MAEQIELAEEKNEAKEIMGLIKKLKPEEQYTVKGIMIGMNMTKENKQPKANA